MNNRFKNFFKNFPRKRKITSPEGIETLLKGRVSKYHHIDNDKSAKPYNNNPELLFNPKGFMSKILPSWKKGMNFSDYLQDLTYGYIAWPFFSMGASGVQDGMDNFKSAKKDKNARVYDNLESIGDKKLVDYMHNVIGVPKDSQGIHYNPYSKQSQKLANSPEIEQFIKEHREELKKGTIDVADITFGTKGNWLSRKDRLFKVNNAKLYKPMIGTDGNFYARGIDYYNFDDGDPKKYTDFVERAKKWGYKMQNKGYMKNYYTRYDIMKKLNDDRNRQLED